MSLLARLARAFSSPPQHPPAALTELRPPVGEFDLSRTVPGRLFLVSLALLAPLLLAKQFAALPLFLEILRKTASFSLVVSGAWLGSLALWRNRRWMLWRVRRKLIISYVLLGVLPVTLLAVFVLAAAFILYAMSASYFLHEGLNGTLDELQAATRTAARDLDAGEPAREALDRALEQVVDRHPNVSFAVVPLDGTTDVAVGEWRHLRAPTVVPPRAVREGFRGVLLLEPADGDLESCLALRVVSRTADATRVVVADIPVDADLIGRLDDRTGTRIEAVSWSEGDASCGRAVETATPRDRLAGMFRQTVAFLDVWPRSAWDNAQAEDAAPALVAATVYLVAPVGQLYDRLVSVQVQTIKNLPFDFTLVLWVLGALLLIVQAVAVVFGAWLGRLITSAVHELFQGTERIRLGDLSHRIRIESRDQLGELASEFNRMSESVAHLLHVQREKQRLDDELRIARDIQKSLLPMQVPHVEGLAIADICEPAREVGGDYFDFFVLGPRQLGVLVADVSGKGTSAALYMAELKGLMLALSHAQRSPRQLLIDVNRRLADQLDNRSFITMTYAVIDLEARTLTCARAGHTPLIIASCGRSEVLVPPGMVLGLRLPGALERFEELLAEHTRPLLPGDVIVLYTDGVTEAMNEGGDLFGDQTLAELLAAHHALSPAGLRERVLRDVKAFVGSAEPHDDLTMVILKIDDAPGAAR